MSSADMPLRKGPSGPETTAGSGITPPAGQIDGTVTDPLIVGITLSDNTELDIGDAADGSFLRRVGTSIVGVAIAVITSVSSPLELNAGTLSILPVSNTSAGVAPQHAGAADVGKALIATANGSAWGTDFGAQSLTTTGSYTSNSNAPVLRLGLAPGSGAGSAASQGDIRLRNNVSGSGPFCYGRNAADNDDVFLWGWNSATIGLQIGAGGGGMALIDIRATTVQVRGTTTTIIGSSGSGIRVDGDTFNFNSTSTAPTIAQLVTSAATVTCQPLSVAAQSGSGATAVTGGAMSVSAGDATGAGGTHTGGATTIRGGDATGGSGTRNGGNITVRPGTGATAQGTGRLQSGGAVNRFSWDANGIGFFTTTPVTQRTLTDSTGGTPATNLVDVGAAYNQANLNNNFASIRQLLNQYGLCA